ncbi:MAG TPA: DUF2892 domain-containing protein [Clostridiales bacterium]|nr:DUF2892 domain-containing protein [Clostridiales bacterium]
MKKNMSTIDSYIRLTAGFYLLGRGVKRSSNFLMIMGSMKIAEGITKWCPVFHICNISTNKNKKTKETQVPENQPVSQIPII